MPRSGDADTARMIELLPKMRADEYERCHEHLRDFAIRAWEIVEPVTPILWNWHLDEICEWLELVTFGLLEGETAAYGEHRGEVIRKLIANIPPRSMKLLADDTPILTPLGWRQHGDLHVGDEVFSPSGKPIKVIAVHPKDQADYRVEFTNHESIECNGEHLWTVYDRPGRKWLTAKTSDLATGKVRPEWRGRHSEGLGDGRSRFQLPDVSALEFEPTEQVLPAYFVGAWLGDGTSTKPAITHAPDEWEVIAKIDRLGINATKRYEHPTGSSSRTEFCFQGVRKNLREIGVLGDKHIPDAYKFGSLEQRLELMAGLIDTDGTCEASTGRVQISSGNQRLAHDILDVATSLGWKPYITEVTTTKGPFNPGGRPHWIVGFNPTHDVPTALERKSSKKRALKRRVGISAITKLEVPKQGNCITVDAADGLYLAGKRCVPTHNSYLITVFWPCWEWTWAPHLRYLTVSHADTLSTAHSLRRRRIIESEWYHTGMTRYWGWPLFALVGDQNVKTRYANTYTGEMIATSIGGTAIGEGGDRVIFDDPQDPKTAFSEAKRLQVNTEWDQGLSTRLNDKKTGAYIGVMQRLHQKDLTGHILDASWVHICREGVAKTTHDITFPRSGRVVHRTAGSIDALDGLTDEELVEVLLWPQREGPTELKEIRKHLGVYGFEGQIQQGPTAVEGGIIKRHWLRYWVTERQSDDGPEIVVLPEHLTGHRQSWDMGLWGKARDDYSAGLVAAKCGANVYILDSDHRRLSLSGCMDAMRTMTADHPEALRKVIESAANGPEVERQLRDEIPGIVTKPAKGSKEARLMAVQPMIESGNLYLPHPREAGWVPDFVEEVVTSPFAENDDWADALSQLLTDMLDEDGVNEAPASGGHRVTGSPTRRDHGRRDRSGQQADRR